MFPTVEYEGNIGRSPSQKGLRRMAKRGTRDKLIELSETEPPYNPSPKPCRT